MRHGQRVQVRYRNLDHDRPKRLEMLQSGHKGFDGSLVRVVGVRFEDAQPNAVQPSGGSRHAAEVGLGRAEAAVEAGVVVVWLSGRDGRKGQCRVTHLIRVRVRVRARVRVRVRVRVRPVRRRAPSPRVLRS